MNAVLAILGMMLALIGALFTTAAILGWLERRLLGFLQDRLGPNRVGPFGMLQWLVDGLKLFMKEDLVPEPADGPMFRLAPYPVMIAVFAAFVSVPFGQLLIAADLAHAAIEPEGNQRDQ